MKKAVIYLDGSRRKERERKSLLLFKLHQWDTEMIMFPIDYLRGE